MSDQFMQPISSRYRSHENLEVVEIEDGQASVTRLESALRVLARMMLRAHRERGHCKPNVPRKNASSSLTLLPTPSPHCDDGTD